MTDRMHHGLGGLRRLSALALVLVSLLVSLPAQAKVLYRWVNDQGATETSHAIPPGLVHRGYEILDGDSMRILKVVPPQMSDVEYQDKLKQEKALAECEQSLDRVNFLYEALEDIDKAEQAALHSLQVRVQNAQQNLNNARRLLEGLEDEAARLERQGSTVNKNHLAKLEKANSQIASLEREIIQRASDKEKMALNFEEERRIFQVGSCDSETLAKR